MTFSTRNDGFKVSFPNGYMISIGTGAMHYCENKLSMGRIVDKPWESKDCEIAVIRSDNSGMPHYVLSNDVEGYVTPLQFARVIEYVSSLPENYASQDIARTLEDMLWQTVEKPAQRN